jgi:hypothetical protein
MDKPERELNEILVKHGYLDNGDLVRTMLPDLLAWRNKRDQEVGNRVREVIVKHWSANVDLTLLEKDILQAIRWCPEVCDKCGRELP